jgi:hypothetical protein
MGLESSGDVFSHTSVSLSTYMWPVFIYIGQLLLLPFSDRVLYFLPRQALDRALPTHAFLVAWIASMYHHAHLVLSER